MFCVKAYTYFRSLQRFYCQADNYTHHHLPFLSSSKNILTSFHPFLSQHFWPIRSPWGPCLSHRNVHISNYGHYLYSLWPTAQMYFRRFFFINKTSTIDINIFVILSSVSLKYFPVDHCQVLSILSWRCILCFFSVEPKHRELSFMLWNNTIFSFLALYP